MNKYKYKLIAGLLLVACGSVAPVFAKTMSVQVRDGQIRDRASFLGRIVANVDYGEQIQTGQEQNGWVAATTARGVSGWIHSSALTTRRIVLQAGASDARTGASAQEVTLAGKGFNASVEKEYKSENPTLNFQGVDWMEAFKLTPQQLLQFLKEGGLAQ